MDDFFFRKYHLYQKPFSQCCTWHGESGFFYFPECGPAATAADCKSVTRETPKVRVLPLRSCSHGVIGRRMWFKPTSRKGYEFESRWEYFASVDEWKSHSAKDAGLTERFIMGSNPIWGIMGTCRNRKTRQAQTLLWRTICGFESRCPYFGVSPVGRGRSLENCWRWKPFGGSSPSHVVYGVCWNWKTGSTQNAVS